MFYYQVLQKTNISIRENILDQIAKEMHNQIKKTQKWTLNIVFESTERIQYLNKTYRLKNIPTDVLSFHYFDDLRDLQDNDIAWEIVIYEQRVFDDANKEWLTPEQQFYKLIIHSTLHILDFDHEDDEDFEEMLELEKQIYKKVFWTS